MGESSGICAIVPLGQEGFRPVVHGMGILVSKREVVTCAHVVGSAGATVRVCFPHAAGACVNGVVDPKRYFPV